MTRTFTAAAVAAAVFGTAGLVSQTPEPRVEPATCGDVTRDAYFLPGGRTLDLKLPGAADLRGVRLAYCSPETQRLDRLYTTVRAGSAAASPAHETPVLTRPEWVEYDVSLQTDGRAGVEIRVESRPLQEFPGSSVEGAWVAVSPLHAATPERPDVILISIDTLRADRLMEYGYAQATDPNIAALSKRGAVFTQAISQAPSTPPSHASMLTGQYPARTGLFVTGDVGSSQAVRGFTLRESLPTLAERLRGAGYHTAAFTGGGFVSKNFGFARGFDLFAEEKSTVPGELMRTASDVLAHLGRNEGHRYFLFLHTYEVHVGAAGYQHEALWAREDKRAFYARYDGHRDGPVNNARYDSAIQFTDAVLGQLFRLLASRGRLGRTLIVITSDHGETMDERAEQAGYVYNHGFSLYDELVRVPLVMHWPGGVPEGRRVERQVEIVDLMPTILDLVKAPALQQPMDGRSLVPLLRDAPGYDKTVAYSESVAGGPFRSAVRGLGYKYVRVLDRRLTSATPMKPPPDEELYDLRRDPGERVNLVHDPAHAGALGELRREMDAILARTGTRDVIAAAKADGQRREIGEHLHGRLVAPGDGVRGRAGRRGTPGDGPLRYGRDGRRAQRGPADHP